ncbi:NAD-dependent deacetylase [Sulfurimonas aquatica]|uniref:protein acetyllysine N-acetyltransferase n=1 Tax=Sulfurimonas aquatica TaxID=2672570 RepID=A0A975B0S3_9BACT|nr:Sir2 family NAD-dependent protein deacetylase [Sulfurimonas aquatica]QSZ42102.1 NAD-dependent deacetylase [Sulfurimonas aquatica]
MAKVIIFSGAGISAESGISTFRDSDGLWENYKIEDICSAGCLDFNYQETIDFYDKRREDISDKKPNRAHLEIKKLYDKYPTKIKLITQNVDDMFEKAGCKNVLHLHGFVREVWCEKCGFLDDIGYDKLKDTYDSCPECHNKLRPNVVFFGEAAPKYQDLYDELNDCEAFIVIGTSGNVINTDMFLSNAIKLSILNNLEESAAINDNLYSKVLYKKATEAIDEIVIDIENFLN